MAWLWCDSMTLPVTERFCSIHACKTWIPKRNFKKILSVESTYIVTKTSNDSVNKIVSEINNEKLMQ